MPELPEVEIASRQLLAWARGRQITAARAAKTRVIRGQSPQRFAALAGHALEAIERRGKWMILLFDGGLGLLSHLGMTGKWVRRAKGQPEPKHVRAALVLEGGDVLDYTDPRLFGRLQVAQATALRALPSYAALGPDPLGGVDAALLHAKLQRTRRSIKEALMDQRTLAGLGNIHVGESLHRAALHPERPADTLTTVDSEGLARAIEASIRFALQAQDGPEPIQYVEEGGDNPFLVYARAGEPCQACGTTIERIVQGGRSTFFCGLCQPKGKRWTRAAPTAAARAQAEALKKRVAPKAPKPKVQKTQKTQKAQKTTLAKAKLPRAAPPPGRRRGRGSPR